MTLFLILSIAGCGATPASTTSANMAPAAETKAVEPVKVEPAASVAPSDGVVNTTTVLGGKS